MKKIISPARRFLLPLFVLVVILLFQSPSNAFAFGLQFSTILSNESSIECPFEFIVGHL